MLILFLGLDKTISLRMQLSLLKGTRRDGSISPHVRESGFQNPCKVCWWNPESSALESGIHLKESGIPLRIGIQNPSSIDNDWNPVAGIRNSRRGIQYQECLRFPVGLYNQTNREILAYTAISKKVVGKSTRNNSERHCG